jgi:signal transduction histidine kinase
MKARLGKSAAAFSAGLAIILAAGFFSVLRARSEAGLKADSDLRQANDAVIAAVDVDALAKIDYSADDAGKPEYRRIREQLLSLGSVMSKTNHIRGYFTVKQTGGRLVLGPDSGVEGDPWHAQPGTVYEEPPVKMLNLMRRGMAGLFGPYTDEYGTFYTAIGPVVKDGAIVGFIGTDFEAPVHDAIVNMATLMALFAAIIVVLAYFLAFFVWIRHVRMISETRERDEARARAAEESEKAKSDFINLAIHQLKTPLTALKWAVEMLEADRAAGAWKEEESTTFDAISSASRRLEEMVSMLLNVGRVEAGRLKFEPVPTDLKEAARGAAQDLAALIKLKRHQVAIEADEGVPKPSVDPANIREVFKNLLSNAVKYTPPGGKITVAIKAAGDDVVASVADEGIGIPANEQGRIFDKFFRASNAAEMQEDGTGLGLYFAREVVNRSGGRMWFESGEGEGTTFFFSLPTTSGRSAKGGRRDGRPRAAG